MLSKNFLNKEKRSILLFLVFPTPNGRLHLGHIGGPYLKLDVIKRYNKQIGNEAFIYGGTDGYDTYVLLKAFNDNKAAVDVCKYYHQGIEQDLLKMEIALDHFVNPILDMDMFSTIAHKIHAKTLSQIKLESEHYPYVEKIGFLPPSFIIGNCPNCSKKIHSFICENCGLYFKPEKVNNLACKVVDDEIELRQITSMFLPVQKDNLMQQLLSKVKSGSLLDTLSTLIDQTSTIRLSIPISWGIKTGDGNSVFYTYGNFFHYLYTLGEKFRLHNELKNNPLEGDCFMQEAMVETVASFGFDNIMSFMINTLNHAITIGHHGLTHYLPSYFLTLNGEKFSTSRNHAIWVENISHNVSIDILRLYLLKTNVDNSFNDFNTIEFIDFYNNIATRLNNLLFYRSVNGNSGFDSLKIKNLYHEMLESSYTVTMPENYCGKSICKNISKFLFLDIKDLASYEAWLECFAILSYPVMPKLSSYIWEGLGLNGFPSLDKAGKKLTGKFKLDKLIKLITVDDLK